MDFDDNLEVKEKLGEEKYWALINAVEVKRVVFIPKKKTWVI